ncbi:alpha-amylase [Clostridium polyendosporum]|uniref:Alpha-amylase n=1 Tax=Clostridium polyendosporum TaxID=69208 RepID=A0A919VH90_9CLOT|nr:alpha-glucosidase [Clostridium polyendosporum]GIM30002.1 alpha-amylase [Clostridium polyendosporum]
MNKAWWHNSVVYQIYPKSFQDSDGDGVGNIKGIISRLDYLKDLGINVIWICPIYKSPMVDHGYDISDYYQIDPSFGTMEDMELLLKECKEREIKVLMDLVINHTSDKHPWFEKAMEDLDSDYADYYIIKEGKDGNPPNNWRSIFGGSAWEKIGDTNKYYLHLFTKAQPDLNWENKELRSELYEMVNYWLEKGLGGFRVDAISHIKKDFSYVNLPADGPDGLVDAWEYYKNTTGIEVFLNELKEKTFKIYDSMTVAEADIKEVDRLVDFIGENGCFSTVFDFCHTIYNVNDEKWKDKPIKMVNEIREKLFKKQLGAAKYGFLSNFIENHDLPRCVNRFIPEKEISFYSESMLGTLYFFLRGIPFIYQGQEIGMTDFPKKSINEFLDLATYQNYEKYLGKGLTEKEALKRINIECREHSRTPFQWNSGENAGFTSGAPWFEINPNYKCINMKEQEDRENSLLTYYKRLISLRKNEEYKETFIYGDIIPAFNEYDGIISYERKNAKQRVLVINNCSNKPSIIKFKENVKQILLNNYNDIVLKGKNLELLPYQSIVLELN